MLGTYYQTQPISTDNWLIFASTQNGSLFSNNSFQWHQGRDIIHSNLINFEKIVNINLSFRHKILMTSGIHLLKLGARWSKTGFSCKAHQNFNKFTFIVTDFWDNTLIEYEMEKKCLKIFFLMSYGRMASSSSTEKFWN